MDAESSKDRAQLNIRIPQDLRFAAKSIARIRGTSLNEFVEDLIQCEVDSVDTSVYREVISRIDKQIDELQLAKQAVQLQIDTRTD